MVRFGRRRLLIAVALFALILTPLTIFLLSRGHDLKGRAARISVGMHREEVEAMLGRPALALRRSQPGTGHLLVWVDILWQVDVLIDGEGRVVNSYCTRSDSVYWRTVGRLIDLPP